MEAWLSWPPQDDLELIARVEKLSGGLLALKEAQYLGQPQKGTLNERIAGLVETLVGGLEVLHWGKKSDDLMLKRIRRVRQLLVKRLPELVDQPKEFESARKALGDLLFCENICSFSLDYARELPSWERLTETVLRIEETASDHIDESVVPMGAVVDVGPALRVLDYPIPKGTAKNEGDPLLADLARTLQGQMDRLLAEGPPARWGYPGVPR